MIHMTGGLIRKNSRRAREYMAAYFILSIDNAADKGGVSELDLKELKPCAATANAIEAMRKTFKTHRSALDFDHSFCKVSINHIVMRKEHVDGNITKQKKTKRS